jgi:hypothetical protein
MWSNGRRQAGLLAETAHALPDRRLAGRGRPSHQDHRRRLRDGTPAMDLPSHTSPIGYGTRLLGSSALRRMLRPALPRQPPVPARLFRQTVPARRIRSRYHSACKQSQRAEWGIKAPPRRQLRTRAYFALPSNPVAWRRPHPRRLPDLQHIGLGTRHTGRHNLRGSPCRSPAQDEALARQPAAAIMRRLSSL